MSTSTSESKHGSMNSRLRLSVHDRPKMLEQLETEVFDLVIIGGGITGAGAARDAASRGLRVALIEAKDFAIGTSSRSSKLVHGGIRYLENYEFHLVFEALSERQLLFELAPHLVHPLRFVLPVYEGYRFGMGMMGLGMWAYDALSMFEAPELHERLSPEETRERLPSLKPGGLKGSYVYSDAYMDDDRLVLETLRSAVSQGALAVNRMKAVEAIFNSQGRVEGVIAQDVKTSRRYSIRGRHVVSTVGVWTDQVATDLLKTWKPILRPSKGVHLTFPRSRFDLKDAVVMSEDKRIVFGIPRHEMFIVGTTDTDFKGDAYDVSVTPEDVRYLLGVTEEYFPGAKISARDIMASYAGVRPLVDDGSATESKTSREHVILADPRGITFIAGGKYTTYRHMAEQTVDAALGQMQLEDQVKFGRSRTTEALNPLATVDNLATARARVDEWATHFQISHHVAETLADRHALEAEALWGLDPGPAFSADERLWTMEALHAIRETMCDSLVDFYFRRVPLALSRTDHGLPLIGRISRAFQEELNWSDTERSSQTRQLQEQIQREFAWRSAFSETST
jgi:glycerol-3-phosphate dehydrogenase